MQGWGKKRDPVTGISGLGLAVNHAMRAESFSCPKFTTAAASVRDMKIVGTRLMQTADCMLNILQRYFPFLLGTDSPFSLWTSQMHRDSIPPPGIVHDGSSDLRFPPGGAFSLRRLA